MQILLLNRRDTLNPEGGGSEVYLERIAAGLVERGHDVTLCCGAHERAGSRSVVSGVQIIRVGTKLGVHREAIRLLRAGVLGAPDVIVDVQNGIPFFAKLAARSTPVVVLVHHIHREQWPVVYGPVRARIGRMLESQVAPWVYRNNLYIAVSEHTRDELITHGISGSRIQIIHNGSDAVDHPNREPTQRSVDPTIVVLGRLVPHKQVEHVLRAASTLRHELSGLRVRVVGDGWWSPELRASCARLGVADITEFVGYVTDEQKHQELAGAWVLALPSLKEGWGLVVTEAAAHKVPAVGYASAGGVAESIVHRSTGLLVDGGVVEFTEALRRLLNNPRLRERMGEAARVHARTFTWHNAIEAFEALLVRAVSGTARDELVDLTDESATGGRTGTAVDDEWLVDG